MLSSLARIGFYPFRLFLVAFLSVLVCQACSSPGRTSSQSVDGSAGAPVSGPQSGGAATRGGAAGPGRVVPAVLGPPPSLGESATYRIGPHDLLKIEVFQVEELSSAERVSESGVIVMPLIGKVQVGGLTPLEAEQEIAGILAKDYLQDPQVNIFVTEYASQDVTVTGAVKNPGVFPIKGRTTLLQAVAMAGGLGELANDEEVVIFRGQGTSDAKAYVVNLDHVQKGVVTDPALIGDDRVIVAESGTAVFFKGLKDAIRGFVRVPVF